MSSDKPLSTINVEPDRQLRTKTDVLPVVLAQDLDLVYPNGLKALDKVSFQVNPGEHVAILGSSGSGKTTLLGCLSGRLTPTAGHSTCTGHSAVIHQDLRLVRQRTALQNVLHGTLGHQPLRRSLVSFPVADNALAVRLLEQVSLADQIHQPVSQLSGGEQQRVAIARALMQNPAILLADEPVASLDENLALETMQLLCKMASERGLTMISVMHDCALAERFADRIFGLESGKLVYNAKPSEAPPLEPIEQCRACQRINAARPKTSQTRVKIPHWRRKGFIVIFAVLVMALYAWSAWSLDIHTRQLQAAGPGLTRFLDNLAPHRWSQLAGLPWRDLLWALVQTIQMSLIGTSLGVLVSCPLAAIAANNVGPRLLRTPTRLFLNLVRTVPSLIWALLFIAAVGLGEFPGVLALTAYSVGYLTKFFYEAFEGVDPGPPGALEEIGASGPQRFMHAVWPAARPAVLSSSLFMLEYNVRAASVLGIVGAGGIGFFIKLYIDYNNFSAVIVCLGMLLVVVILLDALSTRARAWLVRV